MIFRQYNKDFQESDFYEMEIGTAGCMRAYIAKKCDMYFTLEKKLECTDPQMLDQKSNDWRSIFLWLNIVLNLKRK